MLVWYTASVDAAVEEVENAAVFDFRTSIANSENLGMKTLYNLDNRTRVGRV